MVIPKFLGRDCELSGTGTAPSGSSIRAWEVTREVLRHIDAAFERHGVASWTRASTTSSRFVYESPYSTDCLRHWLPNGQAAYSDMSHPELCTAACLSPRRYAAQSLSTLLVAEAARTRAEEILDDGTRYFLTAANVDALDPSISWGTHVNVAVSEDLFEDLAGEMVRPPRVAFVASALAAAIPFFGAGYILPLKDRTVFSLSARAHHLSRVLSYSTTEVFRRGILNGRREPHATGLSRLHLIGFDFNVISAALHGCFLQCLLAAAEEGYCGPTAYHPVEALRTWSWNLDLKSGKLPATASLVDGTKITLSGYMRMLCEQFLAMCEAGLITENHAPHAKELLSKTIELTHHVENGALRACARHLDWAAKLLFLVDLCRERGVGLGEAEIRLADHDFTATRPDAPFWRLWQDGLVDPLTAFDEVEECLVDGPPEARGWARGRLVQDFSDEISEIDWSYVELRRGGDAWQPRLRVEMPRPDSLARDVFAPILERTQGVASLERLLEEAGNGTTEDYDPLIDVCPQLALPEEPKSDEDGELAGSPATSSISAGELSSVEARNKAELTKGDDHDSAEEDQQAPRA